MSVTHGPVPPAPEGTHAAPAASVRPPSILIVDDDHALRVLIVEYLKGHGLRAIGVSTAHEARQAVEQETFDLVLLDLGLPDGDGLDLARQWVQDNALPVICITGRNEEADRVMGLELGADDYITKPFSLREVLARIRAVMRRSRPVARPVTRGTHPRAYRFSGWDLNLNTRRLTAPDGRLVPLTKAEFDLLVMFLGHAQRVISREQIIDLTRAFDDVYDRAIDVQILRLRRKIEADPRKPALLRTERGAGYYFDSDVEAVW